MRKIFASLIFAEDIKRQDGNKANILGTINRISADIGLSNVPAGVIPLPSLTGHVRFQSLEDIKTTATAYARLIELNGSKPKLSIDVPFGFCELILNEDVDWGLESILKIPQGFCIPSGEDTPYKPGSELKFKFLVLMKTNLEPDETICSFLWKIEYKVI